MSVYYSGFSASVESFVNSRKISGAWNETVFGMNIGFLTVTAPNITPVRLSGRKWWIYGVPGGKQKM